MQHGASTLPPDAFDAFPRAGACEIHLATDFMNIVYEHAQFPADLKAEMYAWVREHATDERKPKDSEEQFIYRARKKALGPFKRRLWDLGEDVREAIGQSLETRFVFLMKQLEDRRHRADRRAVRHGAARSRSIARPRSWPQARSRPRNRPRPRDRCERVCTKSRNLEPWFDSSPQALA